MSHTPNQERYVKQAPAAPQRPPQKHRPWLSWVIVAVILVAVAGGLAYLSKNAGNDGLKDKAWSSGHDNVAVINVEGVIMDQGDTYDQEWITRAIRSAANDKKNKAILLRINSPGGAVYQSQETYAELLDYKKETKRPIYAYCEQLTASGGYYIAAAADEIYSNQESFVGSIGVIGGQIVDATGLLDKLGVHIVAPHSGRNKLMGNYFEKPTEEQIAILQSISDEAYEQFVGIVEKARAGKVADVRALADGRIYSARQAKANGLVDGLARYEDYQARIAKKLKNPDIAFDDFSYEMKMSPLDWRNYTKTGLGPLKSLLGGQSELASTVETLQSLEHKMPMYLYEGARP